MIENTILFKQPPPKIGGMLPDAKVSQVVHNVLTLYCLVFHAIDDRGEAEKRQR